MSDIKVYGEHEPKTLAQMQRCMTVGSASVPTRSKNSAVAALCPITCPAITRNDSAISETATRRSPGWTLRARATALTTVGRPPRRRGDP